MRNIRKDFQVGIGVGLFLIVTQTLIATAVIHYLGLEAPKTIFSAGLEGNVTIVLASLFILVCEELVFRTIPLLTGQKYSLSSKAMIALGLLSSLLFGFGHGFTLSGILVQGTWGAAVFYVGFRVMQRRGIWHATIVCVLIHLFINLFSLWMASLAS